MMLLVNGCVSPDAPMKTINVASPTGNSCLFVFLPGKGDLADSFKSKGFVTTVKKAGLPVDMIGVGAFLEYYLGKTFPERLRQDVIIPAKEHGYREIWLVGVSMGGLGGLWYDGSYPGEVTGVVALAPYLGDPHMGWEVNLAGGLSGWNPGTISDDDLPRQIWRGLKVYESQEKTYRRVYIGYGLDDALAVADREFAQVLPPQQVFSCSGGHDWGTWHRLWSDILKRMAEDGVCQGLGTRD